MQRQPRYFKDDKEVTAQQALRGGILRDGFSIRVPAFFKDAARFTDARAFWDRNKDTMLCTDVRRIGGSEGNKPGFRVLDAPVNHQAVNAARAAYLRDLQTAYQNPSIGFGEGFGEQGAIGQRTGDLCTVNGRAGHLRMIDGELQCVADRADAAADEGRRECPDCDGEGEIDGKQCPTCKGSGEVADRADADEAAESQSDDADDVPFGSQDRRTVDEMNAAHQHRMARQLADHARWLSEQWKTGK